MVFELDSSPYYQNSTVVKFTIEKELINTRNKLVHTPQADDDYYIVKDEDTLDQLAFNYYGNAKLWWIIADINDIDHPMVLTTGAVLVIPNLSNIKYGTN